MEETNNRNEATIKCRHCGWPLLNAGGFFYHDGYWLDCGSFYQYWLAEKIPDHLLRTNAEPYREEDVIDAVLNKYLESPETKPR